MTTIEAAVRDLDDDRLEALVEVLVIAAYADGEMSDEERTHFTQSVSGLTGGRIAGTRLEVLVGTLAAELVREGRPTRLARVRQRLSDANTRKTALTLAVKLMAVDGLLRTTERELILELAHSFGVSVDEAASLVRELGPA
jgi:tellurite resistance protein